MINRVILTGRLTRDVEVRKTPSGVSFARFTVACDRRVARTQEQNQQTADFIGCVAWRQQADFLGQYARKGSMIALEGKIQTGSYERDGQRVYTTDVVCDNVQLLESRAQTEQRSQSQANSYDMGYQSGFQQSYAPSQASGMNDYSAQDDLVGPGLDISSDDLPF